MHLAELLELGVPLHQLRYGYAPRRAPRGRCGPTQRLSPQHGTGFNMRSGLGCGAQFE